MTAVHRWECNLTAGQVNCDGDFALRECISTFSNRIRASEGLCYERAKGRRRIAGVAAATAAKDG